MRLFKKPVNLLKTKVALPVFRLGHKLLSGKGLERFALIRSVDEFLYLWLMPKHTTLVVVEGVKINLPTWNVHSRVAGQLLMYGVWEKFQTKLFKESIHRGMVIVDMGAHIGCYTLLAANLTGEEGKVFAFEPEPSNYALLVKNIEANGYSHVIPVEKAVTDRTGTVRLLLDNISDKRKQEAILVDSISLDEFLPEGCAVDVIKMDIEGGEMAALLGMSKVIDRSPNMVIFTEFHPGLLERAGFSPVTYFNELKRYGFTTYVIDEQRQQLEVAPHIGYLMRKLKGGVTNLFCVKGNPIYASRLPGMGTTGG